MADHDEFPAAFREYNDDDGGWTGGPGGRGLGDYAQVPPPMAQDQLNAFATDYFDQIRADADAAAMGASCAQDDPEIARACEARWEPHALAALEQARKQWLGRWGIKAIFGDATPMKDPLIVIVTGSFDEVARHLPGDLHGVRIDIRRPGESSSGAAMGGFSGPCFQPPEMVDAYHSMYLNDMVCNPNGSHLGAGGPDAGVSADVDVAAMRAAIEDLARSFLGKHGIVNIYDRATTGGPSIVVEIMESPKENIADRNARWQRVRDLLPPSARGIPVQLYFGTRATVWSTDGGMGGNPGGDASAQMAAAELSKRFPPGTESEHGITRIYEDLGCLGPGVMVEVDTAGTPEDREERLAHVRALLPPMLYGVPVHVFINPVGSIVWGVGARTGPLPTPSVKRAVMWIQLPRHRQDILRLFQSAAVYYDSVQQAYFGNVDTLTPKAKADVLAIIDAARAAEAEEEDRRAVESGEQSFFMQGGEESAPPVPGAAAPLPRRPLALPAAPDPMSDPAFQQIVAEEYQRLSALPEAYRYHDSSDSRTRCDHDPPLTHCVVAMPDPDDDRLLIYNPFAHPERHKNPAEAKRIWQKRFRDTSPDPCKILIAPDDFQDPAVAAQHWGMEGNNALAVMDPMADAMGARGGGGGGGGGGHGGGGHGGGGWGGGRGWGGRGWGGGGWGGGWWGWPGVDVWPIVPLVPIVAVNDLNLCPTPDGYGPCPPDGASFGAPLSPLHPPLGVQQQPQQPMLRRPQVPMAAPPRPLSPLRPPLQLPPRAPVPPAPPLVAPPRQVVDDHGHGRGMFPHDPYWRDWASNVAYVTDGDYGFWVQDPYTGEWLWRHGDGRSSSAPLALLYLTQAVPAPLLDWTAEVPVADAGFAATEDDTGDEAMLSVMGFDVFADRRETLRGEAWKALQDLKAMIKAGALAPAVYAAVNGDGELPGYEKKLRASDTSLVDLAQTLGAVKSRLTYAQQHAGDATTASSADGIGGGCGDGSVDTGIG
jgi:uncharacterized membrane protein YgcG